MTKIGKNMFLSSFLNKKFSLTSLYLKYMHVTVTLVSIVKNKCNPAVKGTTLVGSALTKCHGASCSKTLLLMHF